VIWYIGFVLSLGARAAEWDQAIGTLWWTLLLVIVLREQIRVETSMRIVISLLEADEAAAADAEEPEPEA
jgi:hypothetical protein